MNRFDGAEKLDPQREAHDLMNCVVEFFSNSVFIVSYADVVWPIGFESKETYAAFDVVKVYGI